MKPNRFAAVLSGSLLTLAVMFLTAASAPRELLLELPGANRILNTIVSPNNSPPTLFLREDGTFAAAGGGLSDADYGDVTVSGSGTAMSIDADAVTEADLKAVDAAVDEECLTYESTTGDFEWQSCSSGGGDNVTVNSGATVDPNFLDGDVDWAYAGTDITATVACSGCVDTNDVLNATLIPDDLDDTIAVGVGEDEYCLTYEHSSLDFAWHACVVDADKGAITVSGGSWSLDSNTVDTNTIVNDTIVPDDLADNAPVDEYCLTYEGSTFEFEWQVCSSGGGDNVLVDSAATTDPDFQDGDVDFTYAAGVVTATVACSGCVDATDLAANSVEASEIATDAVGPAELKDGEIGEIELKAVDTANDEDVLTYETTTGDFEWHSRAQVVCETAWPVNAIFISMSSTNPGTSLGCGTWSAFATGRMLIGVDGGKTWNSAGATGGDVSMQHIHQFTTNVAHSHAYYSATASTGSATCYEHGVLDTSATCGETETTENSGGASPEDTGNNSTEPVPWIAVYMWRRTA